jgi:exodeoxyribonuclease-3
MRIVSYNVNGIRAAISKGFINWLEQANPDVVCLQEIKATPEQLPLLDFELAGYPYHYWFPATKKRLQWCGHFIESKTQQRGFWNRNSPHGF